MQVQKKKLKCADMRKCIDFDNDDMQEQLDKEDKLFLDDGHQSGSSEINLKT